MNEYYRSGAIFTMAIAFIAFLHLAGFDLPWWSWGLFGIPLRGFVLWIECLSNKKSK